MASLEGIISLGPWGGSGGDHWSYRASRGITEIVLRVEGNIKSISFKDASGLVSGTFGGRANDPNDRGVEKKIEIQWPSEYLKSISGTYGSYRGLLVITSLSFITNLTTYGAFGTASGEPFSIPIADSAVVGFHGRCGYYLDALGIFVIPANSHGSISVGQWGGAGGDPFSFRVGNRIKEIIVHEGTNIKSLSFKDGNGREYGKFGGNNANDTGEKRTIVRLWQGSENGNYTCRHVLKDHTAERQLNDKLSQHPESSQSSTTRDDIFTQVMGEDRRGRVRTFGLGVTPSDIFGPRASIAEARAAAAEAQAAALESARIAEIERAQRIALQEEVVQMRTQLNQLMTWMQSFNGNGPSSSSSVPVFGATPNDTQHDD